MALVLADRVRDTTTTTGTGTVTLSGTAPTGYQTFDVGVGNTNTTYYTINGGDQWEVGLGTYSSAGPTLTRDAVLSSSNGGALVNFDAGTKDVFVTYPAEESVYQDGAVIKAGTSVLPVTNGGTGVTSSTGTGSTVRNTSPTLVTPALGTPSSATLTNATGLPIVAGTTGTLSVARGGTGATTFTANRLLKGNGTGAVTVGGINDQSSSEAVYITSAGNVGIGTSSPLGVLQARAGANQNLLVRGPIALADGVSLYSVNDANNEVRSMEYTASLHAFLSGNVGISTTSPGFPLQVNGGLAAGRDTSQYVSLTGDVGANSVTGVSVPGNPKRFIVSADANSSQLELRAVSTSPIQFFTTDTERMRITSSGNVGISTTSPSNALEVAGNISLTSTFLRGSTSSIAVGGSGQPAQIHAAGGAGITLSRWNNDAFPAEVRFGKSRGAVGTFTLPNNGDNLGALIFTCSSTTNMSNRAANIIVSADGAPSNTSSPGRMAFGTTPSGSTSVVERMRITSAGNVGIGTTSPGARLDIVGNMLSREDSTTGANPIILRNSNTGNNTGKSVTALFQGVDTVGTVKNAGAITYAPTDANYVGSNLLFSVRAGDALSERMRITSAGNVGIGTTSPGTRLQVNGPNLGTTAGNESIVSSFFAPDGNQTALRLLSRRVANGGDHNTSELRIQRRVDVSDFGYVGFQTGATTFGTGASTERMRITSAGNVGIGTSSPGTRLQVNGEVRANTVVSVGTGVGTNAGNNNLIRPSSSSAFLNIKGGAGRAKISIANDTLSMASGSGIIQFTTGATNSTSLGAERMRITSAGNVGIGTTSPGFPLDVTGRARLGNGVAAATPSSTNISSTAHTILSGAGGNSLFIGQLPTTFAQWIQSSFTNPSSAVYSLILQPLGGNVGIGTTSPSFRLQLSTDSAAKPSTAFWTIASDSRLKKETGEYTKGLDAVCALRPVTYTYNGTAGFTADGRENISIIAQEAMQHFPECIGTYSAKMYEEDEDETELYNWNGHALMFALVNAVKELKAQNDDFRARIAQLEGN